MILCDLGCPEAPFWEAFGGHFWSFFWNPGFLVFDDRYNEHQTFLEAGGIQHLSFFEVFFKGRFWDASGERFLEILMILGPPWDSILEA